MQLGITFTYSDIFDEPAPELHLLLANSDSRRNITILSAINAKLYLNRNADADILNLLLSGQPQSIAHKIKSRLNKLSISSPSSSTSIFTTLYTLEFIHYELLNFRSVKHMEGAENEFAFLKAYMILSERMSNRLATKLVGKDVQGIPLQNRLWPIAIDQIVSERRLDPTIELVKSIAFLNFMEFDSETRLFVTEFLSKQNKATSWNYVLDIVNIISQVWQQNEERTERFPAFSIRGNSASNSFFEHCTINIEDYQTLYGEQKLNYTGLKATPLFKLEDESLLILNWNFLARKVYEGLIFDFYKLSGIKNKFNEFLTYKNFVSHEFVEKDLFQRTLKGIFNKKNINIRFDDVSIPGHPDAYIRKGKYIFLFEIKDALFPAKVIDTSDYESIKSEVDKKFNAPGKGIAQLIKQIQYLSTQSYEESTLESQKIKRRNVVIYPILVYTDRNFGMPGFNNYLATEFAHKLELEHMPKTFASIRRLTFIDMSFFIRWFDLLQAEKPAVKQVLDSYHDFLLRAGKQFRKKKSMKSSLDINVSFEDFFIRKFGPKINRGERDFVDLITKELNLIAHLPPR